MRFYILGLIAVIATIVLPLTPVSASGVRRADELRVGQGEKSITLFGGKFDGGASVASAVVNGDQTMIVGAGATGGPLVELYSSRGKKIGSFFTLDHKTTSGIMVAAGDIDGDKKTEIIVVPRAGYKPVVEVYSTTGRLITSFLPYADSYLGGLSVAVLPASASQAGKIIVGSGLDHRDEVLVFSKDGTKLEQKIVPFEQKSGSGVFVAAAATSIYGEPIVVVGSGPRRKPEVQVRGFSSQRLLASWLAYDAKVNTGVRVAANDAYVYTVPGYRGSPEVRTFSPSGKFQTSYFAYERGFSGGSHVAATTFEKSLTPVTTPDAAPVTGIAQGKRIEISLGEQRLRMYEYGQLISIRKISSGKWSTPTPIGTFAVRNKIPKAYSKPYNLYMEWWQAITPDGKVGMHALPFWALKNGGRRYEGLNHLGTPVSHGCIRQSIDEAKSLYDWAPIGTPVIVKA